MVCQILYDMVDAHACGRRRVRIVRSPSTISSFGDTLYTTGRLCTSGGPQQPVEQDAAMAAAELYQKLQSGHYRTQDGKRRRIEGDMTKLRFAET